MTPPPADEPRRGRPPTPPAARAAGRPTRAATARINLRLPEQLKARVEEAAGRERLSVNAWLVRAAAAALARDDPTGARRRAAAGIGQRLHRLGALSRPTVRQHRPDSRT